jgi:hypothetical protein
MYTIIISVAIITLALAIYKALRAIRRHDRLDEIFSLDQRFDNFEKENNLKFSKKERLNDFVIGLENVRKKLFVFKKVNDNYELLIVDLKEIKSCCKRKIYKSVVTENRNKETRDLDKIIIEFENTTGDERLQVPFYESIQNKQVEILELEHKAEEWESFLKSRI